MTALIDPQAVMAQMTEHGVGRATWEPLPLPWSWATERLAGRRNFWLVTATPTVRPHATPVRAVWDHNGHRLACACAPGLRKARDLRPNPHIASGGPTP